MRIASALIGIMWVVLGALDAVAQEKIITWATNPRYPPYDWAINKSDYEGACTHLLELIIPDGYTLQPIVVPWARAQLMAQQGSIDLLVNLRITPERSQWLTFSQNPTFPNPIAIFMREDKAIPLKTWEELVPLVGGITIGDAFGNGFDEYLKDRLKTEPISNAANNFRKLDLGRIDYFVTGYYMGLAMIRSAGMQDRIVALKPFVSNQPIHLGFSKHSPHTALLPEIDRRLAQLAKDGTLNRILESHVQEAHKIPFSALYE